MPIHAVASSGLLTVVLLTVLFLSVWFDMDQQRIPNWLTVGGLLGALLLRGIVGPEALWVGTLGAGLGLTLGLLFFAMGALGAGDGKLLMAVGAFLGIEIFLQSLPLIGGIGGALALGTTLRKGTMIPTLLRFRELLFYFVSFGRIGERRTLATPGAVTIPYGVAVAAGAAWAWFAWGLSL